MSAVQYGSTSEMPLFQFQSYFQGLVKVSSVKRCHSVVSLQVLMIMLKSARHCVINEELNTEKNHMNHTVPATW